MRPDRRRSGRDRSRWIRQVLAAASAALGRAGTRRTAGPCRQGCLHVRGSSAAGCRCSSPMSRSRRRRRRSGRLRCKALAQARTREPRRRRSGWRRLAAEQTSARIRGPTATSRSWSPNATCPTSASDSRRRAAIRATPQPGHSGSPHSRARRGIWGPRPPASCRCRRCGDRFRSTASPEWASRPARNENR